jgi:poly(3-hydroxybutyrate) depolymerase
VALVFGAVICALCALTLANAAPVTASAAANATVADAAPGTSAASAPSGARRDAVQSLGCGHPGAHPGELTLTSTDGSGRPRTYLLRVPAAYDASRPYPLVFVFHGAGGNSRQSYSWGLQDAAGASAGGIFVFPDGIAYKNLGIGWDDAKDGYDLPFFDHMKKDIEARYCIDAARVFVAGFSWGGDFATLLACTRGAQIRAVAANSTDDEFKDSANYLTYAGLPCAGGRHAAIRFEHAAGGDKEYPAPYFATTSRLYRYLNSCTAASSEIAPRSAGLVCESYESCAAPYIECTFDHALGHALPPQWAAHTWEFFSAF